MIKMEIPSRSKIFRETIKKRSEQRDGAFEQRDGAFVQSICTKTLSPCSGKGKTVIGDKPYTNMRKEKKNDEISR